MPLYDVSPFAVENEEIMNLYWGPVPSWCPTADEFALMVGNFGSIIWDFIKVFVFPVSL